jgi:broad specificity phosphatase PhoE
LPGLRSVLGELRRGGFVVYFRHAMTDQAGASDEEANLARCETQRNLSLEGREQAARIGQAFRALGIPVGVVTSSPFCRCKDSARLAFGQFTVSDHLHFAMGADADERKRLAEALRRMPERAAQPDLGTGARGARSLLRRVHPTDGTAHGAL